MKIKSNGPIRMSEARGMTRMSISLDLRFHLQGIDDRNDAWENIETMFGKYIIIQAHQLENQLIMTLSRNVFPCIEDYLSKFKTLILLCIECKVDMSEDRFIYIIIANLGSAYSIFESTFYATREALGSAYKNPLLSPFVML
jgi:hypothetical protein